MNLKDLPKELLLVILGLLLTGLGVVFFFWTRLSSTHTSSKPQNLISDDQNTTITYYVDINGSVVKPGVYQLAAQSRVQDVISLAGGLTPEADTIWIEKYLNRAALITDGGKIYIPKMGESTVLGKENSLININLASKSELESLPGVGEATAEKIESGRPYATIDDLYLRKIISKTLFNRIQPQISTW
jgi:competence protein ComEA